MKDLNPNTQKKLNKLLEAISHSLDLTAIPKKFSFKTWAKSLFKRS